MISKRSIQLLAKTPFVLASVGIYYFSSLPQPPFVMTSFQWQDKILHLCAYLFYGIAIAIGIHPHQSFSLKKRIIIIVTIGFVYALSDEFHQSFVPGRTSEIGDLIADWIGVSLAALLYGFMINRKESRYSK